VILAGPATRTTHSAAPLERSKLTVYANRKMKDELLDNDNFSDDEFYPNSRYTFIKSS